MTNYQKFFTVAASMKRVLANLTLREQIEDNGKGMPELFIFYIMINLFVYCFLYPAGKYMLKVINKNITLIS